MPKELKTSKSYMAPDVPEVSGFVASFEYFGYEINESVSPTSAGTRVVRVGFNTVEDTSDFSETLASGAQNLAANIDISEVFDALSSEGDFLDESSGGSAGVGDSHNFSSLLIQDVYSPEKSIQELDAALAGFNTEIDILSPSEGSSAIASEVAGSYPDAGSSVFEEIVSAIIGQRVIEESEPEGAATPGSSVLSIASGVQYLHSIDARVAADVVRFSSSDPMNSFSSNLSYAAGQYDASQSDSRTLFDPTSLSEEDYSFSAAPIAEFNYITSTPTKIGDAQVFGYLLEKSVIGNNGALTNLPSVLLTQPPGASGEQFIYDDSDITLGESYVYGISTIALANVPDIQLEDGTGSALFVVKSRVQTTTITAGTPFPSPPVDIEFFYDVDSGNLAISWNDSPETKNTTKFQILRRDNIQSPFSLLRQYDFDNSIVNFESIEEVNYGLNVKMESPLTFYIDEKFDSLKQYIYALSSVDSMGTISPYSAQFLISIDSSIGDVRVIQVSPSGAPRPYPNFFIDNQLTSESASLTGASNVEIYFTPEVYNVTKNEFNVSTGVVESEESFNVFRIDGSPANSGDYLFEMVELSTIEKQTRTIKITNSESSSTLFVET
ncbi:MAG: hypothetical protein CMA72_09430 [Euryarchaeota archaeon]|nr:hypothetical protein [Euryarchaeota archaeon]|tara:strand:+ start:12316 stop:14145 length:1830 start_codon:yes stop_codon:yes gene_type:complete